MDLDFAVCVNSIKEWEVLYKMMCDHHDFKADRHQTQRLWHSSGIPVDVVPFGEISGSFKRFTWGDDDGFEMSVLGFDEAYDSALSFLINDEFTILVAGYAEQCGLKLLAWADRHQRRVTEDARDIAYLIQHAEEWYGEEALHDHYSHVLENVDYDIELAAAFVLGCDLHSIYESETLDVLIGILDQALNQPEESILIRDIAREIRTMDPEERTMNLLEQIRLGMDAGL
ncbi:MAG: hypothetical protein K8R76_06020, partial [Candidatus Aegiribacteria sp.]|nr:hypothetical protein [Candidatus Aegiribacteria sp.]